MNIKKIILFSIGLLTIVTISLFIYLYSLSGATEYCSLSHKINPDMFCRVCDRFNGKVLIEHFNRDTNELSLSIYENGKTFWIQHPKGKIINYNSSIEKNTIRFDRKDSSNLIVNGVIFPITILHNN